MPVSTEDFQRVQGIEFIRTELLRLGLSPNVPVSEILDRAIKWLRENTKFAGFAVYLLDRRGGLELRGCSLSDPPSLRVEDPDRSALLAGWQSRKHVTAWESQRQIDTAAELESFWFDRIPSVKTLFRVPLNGSQQTFGFIDAVSCGEEVTHSEEVTLSLAAGALAGGVTTRRARTETWVLADLISDLSSHEETPGEEPIAGGQYLDTALKTCLDRLGDWAAAAIHVSSDQETLRVLAKATADGLDWNGWTDVEIPVGNYLAGIAYARNKFEAVTDVAGSAHLFANHRWVLDRKIRACGSYPLAIAGVKVGILTVYFQFPYTFSDDRRNIFLASLGEAFAQYWARQESRRKRQAAEEEVDRLRLAAQEKVLSAAEMTATSLFVSRLHDIKTDFRVIENYLGSVAPLVTGKAATLISRALDVTHRQLGGLEGEYIMDQRAVKMIDPNEVALDVIRTFRMQLKGKKIALRMEPVSKVPLIRVPEAQFRELLRNLVSNAIRAVGASNTGAGEVIVSVGSAENGEALELRVADNGIGIDKDFKERIFERGVTSYAAEGGTGLGLFLVRSLARSYGGSVRVESSVGKGSEFIVQLPFSWITE